MKDRGLVVKTNKDFAQVEVECLFESCARCSAKIFCSRADQSKGMLKVKNPLKASPGDRVEIEISEKNYNKALIFVFSSLLIASLLGMAIGYTFSTFLPISSQEASIIGLILILLLTTAWLIRHFNTTNKDFLYPIIIDIIKKGE